MTEPRLRPDEPGFYWAHCGDGDWTPVRLERATYIGGQPRFSVCYHGTDYSVDLHSDGRPDWGPWERIVWGPRIEPPEDK